MPHNLLRKLKNYNDFRFIYKLFQTNLLDNARKINVKESDLHRVIEERISKFQSSNEVLERLVDMSPAIFKKVSSIKSLKITGSPNYAANSEFLRETRMHFEVLNNRYRKFDEFLDIAMNNFVELYKNINMYLAVTKNSVSELWTKNIGRSDEIYGVMLVFSTDKYSNNSVNNFHDFIERIGISAGGLMELLQDLSKIALAKDEIIIGMRRELANKCQNLSARCVLENLLEQHDEEYIRSKLISSIPNCPEMIPQALENLNLDQLRNINESRKALKRLNFPSVSSAKVFAFSGDFVKEIEEKFQSKNKIIDLVASAENLYESHKDGENNWFFIECPSVDPYLVMSVFFIEDMFRDGHSRDNDLQEIRLLVEKQSHYLLVSGKLERDPASQNGIMKRLTCFEQESCEIHGVFELSLGFDLASEKKMLKFEHISISQKAHEKGDFCKALQAVFMKNVLNEFSKEERPSRAMLVDHLQQQELVHSRRVNKLIEEKRKNALNHEKTS